MLADLCKKFPKLVLVNFTADPEIGRFISQDSYRGELNNPGQWHLYAYCANNPINYVDPSGHWSQTYTRNDCKGIYFLLRAIKITNNLRNLTKFLLKIAGKASVELLKRELLKDVAGDLAMTPIKNFYNKLTEGFRIGGHEYLKVSKYEKSRKRGIYWVTKKEPIMKTWLSIKSFKRITFYYNCYSDKSYRLYK